MTKRDQARYHAIINELSAMGRHGWHHYTWRDWQPLERELAQLNARGAVLAQRGN